MVVAGRVAVAAWVAAALAATGCPGPGDQGTKPHPVTSPVAVEPQGPRLNFLLVTLDTTRADHLGAYGAKDAVTPALDALAARGVLFENAFTPCPLTLPAHATIHTGLQPPEHGLRINGKNSLGAGVPLLAETLDRAGYRTGAFVSAFVLDHKFGLARGFEHYDDDLSAAPEQEVPDELSRSRSGGDVADAALKWLAEDSRDPFFAWVHLYDPHYPWNEHAELEGTALEAKATYDADIAYADVQVARLLAFLDARGLRENTLIVVAGDHGEGLNDHGDIEHGHLLNHEVLHVPLLVASPQGVKAGTRVPAIVSLRDIHPTVLELLGIRVDAPGTGRSLAAALSGGTIASEPSYAESDFPFTTYGWSPLRSLTGDAWKYVRTVRPELYDRLGDEAEVFNLASVRTSVLVEMETALTAVESRMRAPVESVSVRLTPAEKERLASLGYASGSRAVPPASAPKGRPLRDIKDMLAVKHLETELARGVALGVLPPAEVVEAARRLVAASPESARFHARLGAALMDAGKPGEAEEPLREALRLEPDNGDALLNLGRVMLANNQPLKAREQLLRVLAMEPERADVHLSMGRALAALDQVDSALGHYAEAVRLKPDFAVAYSDMGLALRRTGRKEAALAPLARAAELAQRDAAAHYNHAAALADVGRRSEAIPVFRRALELDPDDPDVRNDLGAALQALGDHEGAMAEYRETIRRRPKFARAYVNLAGELADRGDVKGAITSYDEAVRLQPEWTLAAERLAWLLATTTDPSLRDPARAIALAGKAVETSASRSPRPLSTLAEAYAAAGRRTDAIETAERALRVARVVANEELAVELEGRLRRYRGEADVPVAPVAGVADDRAAGAAD